MNIVNKYKNKIAIIVSEKDKGMYDALNKGIERATGDIVGILHADDVFATNGILSQVACAFNSNTKIDAVIGDIAFYNKSGKQVRYYSSAKWNPNKFVWGFMPAHPTFYCKRELFATLGGYRTDFEIAADYELLIRYFKLNNCPYLYLPLLMVKMNLGGKSTQGWKSTQKINEEILKACYLNGLKSNHFMLYSKYFRKIFEWL